LTTVPSMFPHPYPVSRHVSCGSGFPAAMIEAESLSHKKRTYRLMT
jgi:hypothetical protein